jgi:hypothetical protein
LLIVQTFIKKLINCLLSLMDSKQFFEAEVVLSHSLGGWKFGIRDELGHVC